MYGERDRTETKQMRTGRLAMPCCRYEDTCKCPRARNEPFHCPRGHMAAMGRGNMEDGNVENGKCGVTSAETKRDVEKRILRWLDA